jgi:autotransporter strand-loop-strand O-heptosyltransferase
MNIFAHATYVGNSGYNSHCKNFFRNLSKYHDLKVRNFTVGPDWKGFNGKNDDCHGGDVTELDKKLIGLQTTWNSNRTLEDNEVHGYKRGSFKHDVNLILAEANHYYFYHQYEGPKIAYFVWESTKCYEPFFQKLKEYDQIWVPSKWQASCTVAQGADPNKVKVVPEGVDSSVFFPENIKCPNDKFRFLIFGRWDNRKSTTELIRAFKNVFGHNPNVELLVSVEDKFNADGLGSTENRLKHHDLISENIKVLNFPSQKEYANILKSGHVFLSCSRSEGWNLPLIEAMACGTPSIYSDCSGQLEFAAGKGIPVKIRGEIETKHFYAPGVTCQGNWYEPDFKDLESKMIEVYNNYEFYKKKALEESKDIIEKFSWDNAARTASAIMKDFLKIEEPIKENAQKKSDSDYSNQLNSLKQYDEAIFNEIFESDTYEKFCSVENGDVILDLGCSRGYFYFKNKPKDIKYYGVDSSQECISDFYANLNEADDPIVINTELNSKKLVRLVKPFFHGTAEKLVSSMTFSDLMRLMPDRINFLKFDVEGAEKEFLENDNGYKLFKDKVEKFSGELHFKSSLITRESVYDLIKKIQNDPEIYCKLYSCDGVDIDFYFWSNPEKYTEIIISGVVKKNSRHDYVQFRRDASNDSSAYHVINESPCLGDIVAWMPMVDKFQREKACRVNFYSPYGDLFQSVYPNINFDYYNAQPNSGERIIRIAASDIGGKRWSEYNLQELACKFLGIEYEPNKGKVATPNRPKNNFSKKYVCIGTQSTAQFKYWNNPTGWQETVDYLKSLDYEVVCIDKYPVFGHGDHMNTIPNNCINKTGEISLMDRINDIMHCEFFIGLTSGLSWLAWALGKPVIFVSGISLSQTDFPNPYRVTNTDPKICHGCAADPDFIFDQQNWLFCPKNKNFQCTREISFSMVKEKIDILIGKAPMILPDSAEKVSSKPKIEADFSNGVTIKIKDTKYEKYVVKLFHQWKGEWLPFFEESGATYGFEYENCIKSFSWRCEIYGYKNKNLELIYNHTHQL